jgi:hypothetical protein
MRLEEIIEEGIQQRMKTSFCLKNDTSEEDCENAAKESTAQFCKQIEDLNKGSQGPQSCEKDYP